MPLLEVTGLGIDIGKRNIVSDVSFTLHPGDRFGIVGESGSGKTLTALAVAGLLPLGATRHGEISFERRPLPEDERELAQLRAQNIGFVFQEPLSALNPLMRIGAQIREAVEIAGLSYAVEDLLRDVGLEPEHARRFPHQLSGGQRQRVMIAIALACDPKLLIADEPTSALDLVSQKTVLDLIEKLCAERDMALIFISHDLKAVAMLCDSVAVLRGGRLVESGPVDTVLRRPREAYTRALIAASRIAITPVAHPPIAEEILRTEEVGRIYRQSALPFLGGQPVNAVDAVTLRIARGECIALVGPSGCGKTTLARMLVGLDRATSGRIYFEGFAYRGDDLPRSLRAGLSLVFQDPYSSFDPRMTIGQSIEEPLNLQPQLDAPTRFSRVIEAIRSVGLDHHMLARYPHEFSGGQRQRLAIARALVTRPRLVVLDEPVSALDVSVRAEILNLLMRLQSDLGLTYLVISHDLDLVRAIADRVLVMQAGIIVEQGHPAALFAQPRHPLTKALVAARLPELEAIGN
jgi:peptide/nickel transport system ATP-binding protein